MDKRTETAMDNMVTDYAELDRLRRVNAVLLTALKAILAVNDRRRHPLGAPDEGISLDAAQATAAGYAAIARAEAVT